LTSSGHDHHEDVKEKEWNGEGKSKTRRSAAAPFPHEFSTVSATFFALVTFQSIARS
jgi:hypothetical protein